MGYFVADNPRETDPATEPLARAFHGDFEPENNKGKSRRSSVFTADRRGDMSLKTKGWAEFSAQP
jgi:hypothetical protein